MNASADSARSVALEVIRRVAEEGAYSNLTLASALERSGLRGNDRAFAAELAYGTLRRLPFLDWALASHVRRPLHHASRQARSLLRLGTYQVLFTRVPDHAAIAETVGLARPHERGFVNAVLRGVAASRPAVPEGSDDEAVALRAGLAAWAVQELRRLLGDEAELAAAALGERAPLSLRTNTCRVTADELDATLRGAGHHPARGTVHPESLLLEEASPRGLPGYEEGWFAVQDQASSFVVGALDPRPGDRVLDACAGPGGKAGHIACLVRPDGLAVAGDASPARAGLVARQAERLDVRVDVLAQDARAPAVRGPFDRILVDAPCTGLGAARRRPELLWRPRREDLSRLARLQVAVVDGVAGLLRPGGRLVYSVCTFPRAETDAACDAIVRHRPELQPVAVEGPDGPTDRIRLWPHRHGTDAMFVAAFERGG